jgi:2'-5' RNA ligase
VELMRTFVAIAPEDSLRSGLAECARRARRALDDSGIRWIADRDYHFTLAFIGATPPEQIARMRIALASVAQSLEAFSYRLLPFEYFPPGPRARVIAALPADPQPFLAWREAVGRALAATAMSFDHRPFQPHLTVARLRSRRGPRVALAPLDALDGTARSLTLYESRQGEYRPLFTLDCGGALAA